MLNKARQHELQRQWYRRNKARHLAEGKARRRNTAAWIVSLKDGKTCKYCPESFHRCLDWHHRDKETKNFSIGETRRRTSNKEQILAEVAKCDLLCANCHRKVEAGVLKDGMDINV